MSSPAIGLRRLESGDVDCVYGLLSDMRVIRHMLFSLYTREMAEEFVRAGWAEGPGSLVRAIVLAGTKTPIGLCGLVLSLPHDDAEAWYLLAPDHWNRGFASQALRLLLTIGFRERGLHRVWARAVPENPASARVLEKCGMRREGHLVRSLRIHGAWRDSLLYGLLREEWHGL